MGDTKNVSLSDVLEFFRQHSMPVLGMFSEVVSASCGQVMGDTKNVTLSDVLEFFCQHSMPVLGMFSEVVTLSKLLLVISATNASSERSFSTLRRIETYLRTTMAHTRLNRVMVLHVHNNRTDLLELGRVASDFISENESSVSIVQT